MSAVQSIFELHVFLHVEENERAEFFALASSRRVAAELVRIGVRALICWHFSFFRSCQPKKLLASSSLKFGSSGRIRRFLPLYLLRLKRSSPS
jgi:hypothetical protein